MKKLIFGSSLLIIIGIVLFACNKVESPNGSLNEISVLEMEPSYSKAEVQLIIDDLNSDTKAPPKWFQKIKKWFKDHTGTHLFDNCEYSNPCGPCPGLCLNAGIVGGDDNDGDEVSDSDYQNGLRAYGLSILEHVDTKEETVMFLFNEDLSDFTSDGFFYIEEDMLTNSTINNSLGKERIKILKGKYHVVKDTTTGYYYSLMKSEIR